MRGSLVYFVNSHDQLETPVWGEWAYCRLDSSKLRVSSKLFDLHMILTKWKSTDRKGNERSKQVMIWINDNAKQVVQKNRGNLVIFTTWWIISPPSMIRLIFCVKSIWNQYSNLWLANVSSSSSLLFSKDQIIPSSN